MSRMRSLLSWPLAAALLMSGGLMKTRLHAAPPDPAAARTDKDKDKDKDKDAAPSDDTKAALDEIQRAVEQKKAEHKDQKALRQKAARLNRRSHVSIGPARVIPPGRHIEMFGGMLNRQVPAPFPAFPGPGLPPRPGFGVPGPMNGWFGAPMPPQVQTFQGPGGGGFVMRWGF